MSKKRIALEDQIKEFIKSVLDIAETQEKLEHINMEISNHQGNLQMDFTVRNRKKVY
ncbi:hypothetical protein [Anaerophilus nitritogenes]|uniref:hypothetical protein n=1 Tax=Anaerophilus nitritogenes TaxID=2498136 RepID=UPI0013EDCF8B|nr:hypothetical protein [Anaerophilus nitritogenes]